MLAGDGLPEGSTDLVTLFFCELPSMRGLGLVYLRTDRSGGEPVARKAEVSWCFILCCASQENAGFC